jgi:hypothetical protein
MNFLSVLSVICLISASGSYAQTVALPAAPPPPPSPPPPSPPGYVSPCVSGMYNPCGYGSCVDLLGSYRCICPTGYELSTRRGSPFCSPVFGFSNSNLVNYTTVAGDTCVLVGITFRVSVDAVSSLAPGANCDNLPGGLSFSFNSPLESRVVQCRIRHTVVSTDTCASMRARFRSSAFISLNPALSCSALVPYSSICVQNNRDKNRFYYCKNYRFTTISSSSTCTLAGNALRTLLFNQGLLCGNLDKFPKRFCASGVRYRVLSCRNSYTVGSGDTCASIVSDVYNGSRFRFRTLNRRLVCDDAFLFVGQKLCLR